MTKKAKIKEVVIKREGTIRDESPTFHAGTAWILHLENQNYIRYCCDVAKTALKAGYEVGDRIKYKIIIEPKR